MHNLFKTISAREEWEDIMGHNILIGLSGGPSVAINSSLAGIIHAAVSNPAFDKIYGAHHGIEGVLEDHLIDLSPFADEKSLALLRQTPAMALGSCRKKLRPEDYSRIDERMQQYGIGAFFYIGGNDSMDTVMQLDRHFKSAGIKVQVIGVPKTIDNDLPVTDHTPGFGSAAKYLYYTMNEIIKDSGIYPVKNVVIVEVMGRDSGWLTLAAGLSHYRKGGPPHIIALPEVPFDQYGFIDQIKTLLKTERTVICAVSEGIRDKSGEYIGAEAKSGRIDTFGHPYLSGVGKYLEYLVAEKLGCKVRSIELNVLQRCASHLASKTDLDEAYWIGEEAVRYALLGESGVTMVFRRRAGDAYQIDIAATPVENVANMAKDVPERWLDLSDETVRQEIINYLLPLIQGDFIPVRDETGLPVYIDLF